MPVKFNTPKVIHTPNVTLDALYVKTSTSTKFPFKETLAKHKAVAIGYEEYALVKITAADIPTLKELANELRAIGDPIYATLHAAIGEVECIPSNVNPDRSQDGIPMEMYAEILKKIHKDQSYEEEAEAIATVANLYLWEAATWTGNDKLTESSTVLKGIRSYNTYIKSIK